MMLAHELGAMLAGMTAPMAFLWLGLAYFRRGSDVRDHSEALRRQLEMLTYPAEEAEARISQVSEALRKQAEGRRVLVIVDDAWSAGPVEQLSSFLDPETLSRRVVTTRIHALVPNTMEIPLGVLPPDEAARLMLSVGDAKNKDPPYSKEALEAAKACGGLPLTLAVAGEPVGAAAPFSGTTWSGSRVAPPGSGGVPACPNAAGATSDRRSAQASGRSNRGTGSTAPVYFERRRFRKRRLTRVPAGAR